MSILVWMVEVDQNWNLYGYFSAYPAISAIFATEFCPAAAVAQWVATTTGRKDSGHIPYTAAYRATRSSLEPGLLADHHHVCRPSLGVHISCQTTLSTPSVDICTAVTAAWWPSTTYNSWCTSLSYIPCTAIYWPATLSPDGSRSHPCPGEVLPFFWPWTWFWTCTLSPMSSSLLPSLNCLPLHCCLAPAPVTGAARLSPTWRSSRHHCRKSDRKHANSLMNLKYINNYI